jgi:biopolymer transport protein ExbD
LRTAKAESEDVVCLIAADKEVAHGRVVWLIDFIRSEGIARFAINIDKAVTVPPDPATVEP